MATVQFAVAASLAMLFTVLLTNLVVMQYGRGAIRAALERGVRVGTVEVTGTGRCDAAIADSLGELLGGRMGEAITVTCRADDEQIVASATGTLPGWLPLVPDLAVDLEAIARREPWP